MLAAATWLSNSIAKTQAALSEVSLPLEVGVSLTHQHSPLGRLCGSQHGVPQCGPPATSVLTHVKK